MPRTLLPRSGSPTAAPPPWPPSPTASSTSGPTPPWTRPDSPNGTTEATACPAPTFAQPATGGPAPLKPARRTTTHPPSLAADQQKEGILLCPTTSASVTIPNTVSSPPPHRTSPLTWPSGSSSASSSSPSPFRRACTASPSRNATGCAVPAKPSTTCAASATACMPTFASTRPSPPAHHARTGRTGSRSAAAVSPKQQPAERRSAPHRPPLPRPRPGRSRRSPPTHRPST